MSVQMLSVSGLTLSLVVLGNNVKTIISEKNPFGVNRYGFLWEKLNELNSGKHLDYGAYDGAVLKQLIETNVIKEGFGVD